MSSYYTELETYMNDMRYHLSSLERRHVMDRYCNDSSTYENEDLQTKYTNVNNNDVLLTINSLKRLYPSNDKRLCDRSLYFSLDDTLGIPSSGTPTLLAYHTKERLLTNTCINKLMTPRLFRSTKPCFVYEGNTRSISPSKSNYKRCSNCVESIAHSNANGARALKQTLATSSPTSSSSRMSPICRRKLEQKPSCPEYTVKNNNNNSVGERKKTLVKCKSESNLVRNCEMVSDDDDYGFLKWPYLSSAAALKPKSPSKGLFPKRWRSKSKSPEQNYWSNTSPLKWESLSGHEVTLTDTSLLGQNETERTALRKFALTKLNTFNLGCPIAIPKQCTRIKRKKRVLRMLRKKSHSVNAETLQGDIRKKELDNTSDCQPTGLVFGIPLAVCIANDTALRCRRSASQLTTETQNLAVVDGQHQWKTSSSSMSSETTEKFGHVYHMSIDSLTSENPRSNLNLSHNVNDQQFIQEDTPQTHVPYIVETCFKHLRTFGFNVTGIFRVGGSKKRIKQLRDEFDSGKFVRLTKEHSCHDVACLLKEFFRDLPEPLLTRDLYLAFLATIKLDHHEQRIMATKLLISLVPVVTWDTLYALLKFLGEVALYSNGQCDSHGNYMEGNKMDSRNLATVFGPNILRKAKYGGSSDNYRIDDIEHANERKDVIDVVQYLIDNTQSVFHVSATLRSEMISHFMRTNKQAADKFLSQLAASSFGNAADDPNTVGEDRIYDMGTKECSHSNAQSTSGSTNQGTSGDHQTTQQHEFISRSSEWTTAGPRLDGQIQRMNHSMTNLNLPEWSSTASSDETGVPRTPSKPLVVNLTTSRSRLLRTPDSGLSSQTESINNSPRISNLQHEAKPISPNTRDEAMPTSPNPQHEATPTSPNPQPEATPTSLHVISSSSCMDNSCRTPDYKKSFYIQTNRRAPSGSSYYSQFSVDPSPLVVQLGRSYSSEWDRDQRWDDVTSDSGEDSTEQETLV